MGEKTSAQRTLSHGRDLRNTGYETRGMRNGRYSRRAESTYHNDKPPSLPDHPLAADVADTQASAALRSCLAAWGSVIVWRVGITRHPRAKQLTAIELAIGWSKLIKGTDGFPHRLIEPGELKGPREFLRAQSIKPARPDSPIALGFLSVQALLNRDLYARKTVGRIQKLLAWQYAAARYDDEVVATIANYCSLVRGDNPAFCAALTKELRAWESRASRKLQIALQEGAESDECSNNSQKDPNTKHFDLGPERGSVHRTLCVAPGATTPTRADVLPGYWRGVPFEVRASAVQSAAKGAAGRTGEKDDCGLGCRQDDHATSGDGDAVNTLPQFDEIAFADGDTCGYVFAGHVEPHMALQAVRESFTRANLPVPKLAVPAHVHGKWERLSRRADGHAFSFAKPDEDGAEPVTWVAEVER